MRDRLADYLDVLGLTGSGEGARLMSGQFHDVVLAGDVAYRFARDEPSRRALPAVASLLAALGRAGLPVPFPLSAGPVPGPPGQCYLPLSRITGEPLGPVSGPRAEQAVVAELAGLLDRLAGLGADSLIQGLIPRAGPDQWTAFAGQVRDVLYPLMSGPGRSRADAELAAVTALAPSGAALVHGDLGGANLLWTSPAGLPRLSGVLDWDGACIGDQASDLASIAVTVGWPLAARIDSRRGGARPLLADARVIAATFALQQALPAALSGDQASLDDGLLKYR
jgi:aminoglycoside phosphotransferase (APT) family kinase protein